jgi:hypothetical protein
MENNGSSDRPSGRIKAVLAFVGRLAVAVAAGVAHALGDWWLRDR